MAASNCGQILQEREDPFDLKVADIFCFQIIIKILFRKLIMIFIKMLIKCYQ